MAYMQPPPYQPQPPPQRGPKVRPPQVEAAVLTQFVIAAAAAATGVAALAVSDTVREGTVRRIYSNPDLAELPDGLLDGLLGAGLVGEGIAWIVCAAFHVVLGILNDGGRRPARILSWVLAGVSLAGCGLGSLGARSASGTGSPDTAWTTATC